MNEHAELVIGELENEHNATTGERLKTGDISNSNTLVWVLQIPFTRPAPDHPATLLDPDSTAPQLGKKDQPLHGFRLYTPSSFPQLPWITTVAAPRRTNSSICAPSPGPQFGQICPPSHPKDFQGSKSPEYNTRLKYPVPPSHLRQGTWMISFHFKGTLARCHVSGGLSVGFKGSAILIPANPATHATRVPPARAGLRQTQVPPRACSHLATTHLGPKPFTS